jgi:DNA-binding GntR family transcriptional regulator
MTVQKRLLPQVKSASLRTEVIDSIREAILSGKLPPGTPLRGFLLARDLGVSQGTVREALLQLEHRGLVTNLPGNGTAVTRLSGKELRERVSLRALLEGEAGVEAAPRMTAEDFAELDKRLQETCRTVAANLHFESAEADLEFHRYIWQCSGNETVYRVLDQLSAPLLAFIVVLRRLGLHEFSDSASAVAWQQTSHQPLINALKDGRPEVIRKAFASAIAGGYERYYDWATKNQHVEPPIVREDTVAPDAAYKTRLERAGVDL